MIDKFKSVVIKKRVRGRPPLPPYGFLDLKPIILTSIIFCLITSRKAIEELNDLLQFGREAVRNLLYDQEKINAGNAGKSTAIFIPTNTEPDGTKVLED